MKGDRLRQLRLARGFTLEGLAARMGGVVTKQALSKYEQGKAQPTALVLTKLAAALGVKAVHLWTDPEVHVAFVAYRRRSSLRKMERERVEALTKHMLEQRVRLQVLTGQGDGSKLPVRGLRAKTLEDAERRAEDLRVQWDLGLAAIASVVDVLEEHFVHVLEIDAKETFDGTSAVAYNDAHGLAAAAVVTRRGLPGERQRLSLAHELGHLVLNTADTVDEEDAAFRFGGAFLVPAAVLRQQVGLKRSLIDLGELFLLREQFGMSIQALLYRLRDLRIITESYYKQWCKDISQLGWKKREPREAQPERPRWARRTVRRALAQGLVTQDEAENVLGEELKAELPLSLVERRAFMKLPLQERRRILARQAEAAAAYAEEDYADWKHLQGGDFVSQ